MTHCRGPIQLAIGILLLGLAQPSLASQCPTFEKASKGLPETVEWRSHPAFADVNGDGRLDLAANPRKHRNPEVFVQSGDGWKRSSTGLMTPGFTCGWSVRFADVNGDGLLDLGVADHCNGLFVFYGNGKGQWKPAPAVMKRRKGIYDDMDFGDLDGDGDLDLVALGSMKRGFVAYENDGTGNFTLKKDTGLPAYGYGHRVQLADLNGDGLADVVASFNPRTGPDTGRTVWISNGDGKLHAADNGLPQDGKRWSVAVGDVNADGQLDLALTLDWMAGRAPIQVFLGDGGKSWTAASQGLPTGEKRFLFMGVDLGDLNGDGHLDLVAVDHMRAGLRVWLGDGTGAWKSCDDTGLPTEREGEPRGWGVTLGDVNGDGKLDLAAGFGRNKQGSLEVWVQR